MNQNLRNEQFASMTKANGGASMYAQSGHIVKPGSTAFLVGGVSNSSGQRIPTEYVPQSEFNDESVEKHRQRIANEAPDSKTMLGSWVDNKRTDSPVEIDASESYPNLKQAIEVARSRREKAVFSNARGASIYTRPKGSSVGTSGSRRLLKGKQ
jgi:hypothetical protein